MTQSASSSTVAPNRSSPASAYWLNLALLSIFSHQLQSFILEPRERLARVAMTAAMVFTASRKNLTRQQRGWLYVLVAAGPTFGSFAGHLVPLVRQRRVPTGSETAPLNLGGGALLLALGIALLRSPDADAQD